MDSKSLMADSMELRQATMGHLIMYPYHINSQLTHVAQLGIVVKHAAKTGCTNIPPAPFHYLNPGHALISSTYRVFLFPAIKKGGMEQGGVERVECEDG